MATGYKLAVLLVRHCLLGRVRVGGGGGGGDINQVLFTLYHAILGHSHSNIMLN